MSSAHIIRTLAITSMVAIGGCASESQRPIIPPYSTSYQFQRSSFGDIESIQEIHAAKNASGADVTEGANGSSAAALAGSGIEQNSGEHISDMYQIRVRLTNGDRIIIEQDGVSDLHVGSHVRVVDGRAYGY